MPDCNSWRGGSPFGVDGVQILGTLSRGADMNRQTISYIWVSALCLMTGCSSKSKVEVSPQVRVQELCTDDTLSRTDYVNVPLVRVVGPRIELNGAPVPERELLDWAQKKYRNLPELALWVQVSPERSPIAERALLPLVQSLPQLQLRRVAPDFTCPKLRKGN
jgi:hypothetical protein